jgi:hypothetical protein
MQIIRFCSVWDATRVTGPLNSEIENFQRDQVVADVLADPVAHPAGGPVAHPERRAATR